MTECELIAKTLSDAYDFILKHHDSEEANELIINLFKSKLLIKNCTISAVSESVCNCRHIYLQHDSQWQKCAKCGDTAPLQTVR